MTELDTRGKRLAETSLKLRLAEAETKQLQNERESRIEDLLQLDKQLKDTLQNGKKTGQHVTVN